MTKEKATKDELGQVVDALSTALGIVVSISATPDQKAALLELLDHMTNSATDPSFGPIRAEVMRQIAGAVRSIESIAVKSGPAPPEALQ